MHVDRYSDRLPNKQGPRVQRTRTSGAVQSDHDDWQRAIGKTANTRTRAYEEF